MSLMMVKVMGDPLKIMWIITAVLLFEVDFSQAIKLIKPSEQIRCYLICSEGSI
jgi:hypothetical protein